MIRHSAHAVRASAEAHRHAPGARDVVDVVRVAVIARALVRSGALTVQARIPARCVGASSPVAADATAGVGIVVEARLAKADVHRDASAVRTATVPALRARRVRGCAQRDASTGVAIRDESPVADATTLDADPVRAAIVHAVPGVHGAGRRRRHASTGVGIHVVAVSAL